MYGEIYNARVHCMCIHIKIPTALSIFFVFTLRHISNHNFLYINKSIKCDRSSVIFLNNKTKIAASIAVVQPVI